MTEEGPWGTERWTGCLFTFLSLIQQWYASLGPLLSWKGTSTVCCWIAFYGTTYLACWSQMWWIPFQNKIVSKKTTVVSLNHVLINPVVYSIEILNGYTIFTYINDIGAFNKKIKKVSDTVHVIKHTFCL